MTLIETQFQRFSSTFDILELVGLSLLLFTFIEVIWDFVSGTRKNWRETVANFAILIVSSLLERTAFGLIFIVGLVLANPFAVMKIPITWWSWILAILVADLTYYWMHRLEHKVRILWAHHSVHHSSPEYNLTTALRIAWVDGAIEWVFFVPMILIGFDVVQATKAVQFLIESGGFPKAFFCDSL